MSICLPKKKKNDWDEFEIAIAIEGYEHKQKNSKNMGNIYSKMERFFRGLGYERSRGAIEAKFLDIEYSLTGKGRKPKYKTKSFEKVIQMYKDYKSGKNCVFERLLNEGKRKCKNVSSNEVKSLQIDDWIHYERGSKPYYCTFLQKDIFGIDRNTYRVYKNWASMYRALVREIYQKKRFDIPFYLDGELYIVGKDQKIALKRPKDFITDLYVENPCDPLEQLKLITLLLNKFGYCKNDIHVKCKD